jgi:hypothetical protein
MSTTYQLHPRKKLEEELWEALQLEPAVGTGAMGTGEVGTGANGTRSVGTGVVGALGTRG